MIIQQSLSETHIPTDPFEPAHAGINCVLKIAYPLQKGKFTPGYMWN